MASTESAERKASILNQKVKSLSGHGSECKIFGSESAPGGCFERVRSFIEVDQVLTEAAARGESDRCLYCCLTCYNPDGAAGGHAQPVLVGKDA
jgi:hypothetical protein